ncbi:MAG: hypothetical protein [Caudoviricetes sp.]|nr:MAG: hypothetical protein [Caudoviricetes sp.]
MSNILQILCTEPGAPNRVKYAYGVLSKGIANLRDGYVHQIDIRKQPVVKDPNKIIDAIVKKWLLTDEKEANFDVSVLLDKTREIPTEIITLTELPYACKMLCDMALATAIIFKYFNTVWDIPTYEKNILFKSWFNAMTTLAKPNETI